MVVSMSALQGISLIVATNPMRLAATSKATVKDVFFRSIQDSMSQRSGAVPRVVPSMMSCTSLAPDGYLYHLTIGWPTQAEIVRWPLPGTL